MAKNNNDWKDRLNVVYSTNPDFSYDTGETEDRKSTRQNSSHGVQSRMPSSA